MNMTFRYLVQAGVPLDLVLQFCDNCAGQYKSRRPFVEISRCALNLIRTYFGEKHGKSHADALFGRLKAWMSYKIKSRHFVVKCAFDFYKFCREYYETPILKGCCQHYRVHFEFIRPCDVRRHQDSDLDKAVEHTQTLFSVRNTNQPLQLKVRSVPCLCSGCIRDDGTPCENSGQTDPWRLVNLIPSKGANKNKYKKRPRPDIKKSTETEKSSSELLELENLITSNVIREGTEARTDDAAEIHSDDENAVDDENDEITFEIVESEDEKSNETTEGKKENTREVAKNDTPVLSDTNVIDKVDVTDNVTDMTSKASDKQHGCSWINVNEEITEQDFISSDSESDDVELINVCQRTSKEFGLASENFIPTEKSNKKVTDIFKSKLPQHVIWRSILTALHECTDSNSLFELCEDLKREMPTLQPRVKAVFQKKVDRIDRVAQGEIPKDGPTMLTAVFTEGDGNCFTRSSSRGYFNTDAKHLELRARIVVEGVLNKDLYLNNNYLERGATYIHGNAQLPTVFASFSEYYTPGQLLTDDSISCIYSLEIHSVAKEGTYMGLWQITQASSVLDVPIHTIYPVRGKSTIRNDFHRMFFPVYNNSGDQDDEPLIIMWTGVRRGGVPIHFVPLLPSDDQ